MAKSKSGVRPEVMDFLLKMREEGAPISAIQESALRSGGFRDELNALDGETEAEEIDALSDNRYHLWIYPEQKDHHVQACQRQYDQAERNLKSAQASRSESGIKRAQRKMAAMKHEMTITRCYYDRIPKEWFEEWKDREITTDDWMVPDFMTAHEDPEFRSFWDSHIPAFCKLLPNKRFWLYLEQNRRMLADSGDIDDFTTYHDQLQWTQEQLEVMSDSSLYLMDRCVWIKEAAYPGGKRKYRASTPQALWLYALDCLFSSFTGKGRQAALTSTAAPALEGKALTRTGFQVVFAADDVENKAEGIFEQKFKYSFSELPEWIKPEKVPNWSKDNVVFDFAPGDKKHEQKRYSSEVSIVSAMPTSINSKTPDIVGLDEATDMQHFGKIMTEVAPTMLQYGPDGTMRRARQLIAWSTGTSSGKGKGQYEAQYMKLLDQWHQGVDTQGFVPLFFDWTCRPGMTREVYLGERDRYLKGESEDTKGLSEEEAMAAFKSHYPSVPEDMFLTSHKTILPMVFIQSMMDTCRDMPPTVRPVRGYFEPVYDKGVAMPPGSPFPYLVKDAVFVPADDEDPNAPVEMFLPPDQNECWSNRWFQGTDPLMHEDGYSHMASAIYDRVGVMEGDVKRPNIACMVDTKHNDLSWRYMQCILMGIHYRNRGEKACKHVVEANVGKPFTDMIEGPCFNLASSLVLRTEMEEEFTGGNHIYGVDNKAGRKKHMLTRLREVSTRLKGAIPYYGYWSQVRTLKIEKTDTGWKYGTLDVKRYNDDRCDAVTFAYMAHRAFSHRPVEYVDPQVARYKQVERWKRDPVTLDPIRTYETVEIPA